MKRQRPVFYAILIAFLMSCNGLNLPQVGDSFFIARFKVDGSWDKSFQAEGISYAAFGEDAALGDIRITGVGKNEEAAAMVHAVKLDRDMRIIAAGCANVQGKNQIAIARFVEKDGALDSGFGAGGKSLSGYHLGEFCEARSLTTDPKNRIITAGFVQKENGPDYSDFALACYREDGKLDSTFGFNGTVTTNFWDVRDESAYAVGVTADRKIVAGGVGVRNDYSQLVIARYTMDGDLDRSFGPRGKGRSVIKFDSKLRPQLYDMVVDKAGRIIAAGRAVVSGRWQFVMIRTTISGKWDRSFGSNGVARIDIPGAPSERAAAITLDHTNTGILIAGQTGDETEESQIILVRFNSNGRIDRSFGETKKGYTVTNISRSKSEKVNDIAVDITGKIILAGRAAMLNGTNQILIARYHRNGRLDETLKNKGYLLTSIPDASDQDVLSVAVDPFGNIIVGGWAEFKTRATNFEDTAEKDANRAPPAPGQGSGSTPPDPTPTTTPPVDSSDQK